jgi:hypothetical protein
VKGNIFPWRSRRLIFFYLINYQNDSRLHRLDDLTSLVIEIHSC